MKRSILLILLILISVLLYTSCITEGAIRANSTSEIPNLQQKYAARFDRTSIGMSLDEFRKVWPEAIKYSETTEYSIYEFRESTKYYTDDDYNKGVLWTGTVQSHEYIQIETFYFSDNKLIKYEYKSGTTGLNS